MVARIVASGRAIDGDVTLERARRAASAFGRMDVGEGDVIALLLRNEPVFLEAALAARLAGAYACPINWHLKPHEVAFVLADSGASALVAHADLLAPLADVVPARVRVVTVRPPAELQRAYAFDKSVCEPAGDAVAWEDWLASAPPWAGPARAPRHPLLYSSGTTGRAKGVRREPLAPEHLARTAERVRIAYGVAAGSRTAVVAPLYHAAPVVHGMARLLVGDLVVVLPRFEPEDLLAAVEQYRLNRLLLVPTMLVRLLRLPTAVRERYDLSSLESVGCTGAPLAPETKRAAIEWLGPIVTETYASTETGGVTFCTAEEALQRPGTVGRPLPGVEVRILDADGDELPPRTVGAVYCRQIALPPFEYVNLPDARREIECHGMITLGDVGYLDEDGYLYLCDRAADLVISGGVNIYPAEIEAVLLQMPEVVDCAVFGIPDAEFGEALAAHVELCPTAEVDPAAIRAFVAERLAGFKVPRLVEIVPSLPREPTGKVKKRLLREPFWRDSGRSI